MALGIYTLILIAITVVSGISVALLFLTKYTKAKYTLFYFVSLWNILVAYISATSLPMNFMPSKLFCWALGFLSVIAICIHVKNKQPKVQMAANILSSAALIIGVLKLLFF